MGTTTRLNKALGLFIKIQNNSQSTIFFNGLKCLFMYLYIYMYVLIDMEVQTTTLRK